MIPMYTTSVGLPKICLAFDWPTQMKIPRTALGDGWKTAKIIKGNVNHTNIDIQAILVWLTLPFYDFFCGFRSVAIYSVYKLQFFYIFLLEI